MKKKKYMKFIIMAAIIAIATIIIVIATKGTSDEMVETTGFETMTIGDSDKIFINGTVQAVESKSIYLDQSKGTVDSVSVKEGQAVNVGDVLFTYKNSSVSTEITDTNNLLSTANNQKSKYETKKNEANNNISRLQSEIESLKAQLSSDVDGSISAAISQKGEEIQQYKSELEGYDSQIDEVASSITSYNSKLSSLKEQEAVQVKADVNGIVSIVGNTNDYTNPYMKIASNDMCVRGTVNEKSVAKVNVDDEADLLIIATEDKKTGKISEVSKDPIEAVSSDGAGAGASSSSLSSYNVTITIGNAEQLINGYHVQATVKSKTSKLVIPKSAIISKGNKNYVFIVKDNKLKKVKVSFEDKNEDDAVVLSGLKDGDEIVTNPSDDTKAGMSVE